VISHYDSSSCPTGERFAKNNRFIRFLMGPFGSAKSTTCVHELVRRACLQGADREGIRKSRWAVVRNTYPQLRDSTIRTFLDWYPEGVWGTYKVEPKEFHMKFRLEDGTEVHAEILFRALDSPRDIANLLGVEYTGAWIDEAREVGYELFAALQGRVGRYPSVKDGVGATWDGIMMCSNPPDMDHWLYNLFEVQKPDNAEAFYQPSGLSPKAENLANLKKGYYENMAVGKDPDWVKVYIEGAYGFVREGKPVYLEYKDAIHCSATVRYDANYALVRGWDFGRTPACVWLQVTNRGKVKVIDEMTSDGMGIEVFAKEVLDYTKRTYPNCTIDQDVGDPSGGFGNEVTETTAFSVLWDLGINIEEGVQDPDIRISAVKTRLSTLIDGEPAFMLSDKCNVLRKGFIGGYCYKRMQMSGERYADKPDKQSKYSHPHDALQYPMTRLFEAGSSTGRAPKVVGGFR